MQFYDFHIGDFAKKTQHLTNEEELAYRRALDLYYDTEKPLDISNIPLLSRRLRVGLEALQNVINEFFPEGKNKHADEKIADYYAFLAKQSANGKKGGRPKNQVVKIKENPPLNDGIPTDNPPPSQPLPINHKPLPIVKASRLSKDWELPADYGNWALGEKPEWSKQDVLEESYAFKDYWIAKSGKDAAKLDWEATWRNWIRNSRRVIKNA